MNIRSVTDPDDPVIAAFGELQNRAYFAPDMLIPARYIALMLGQGEGTRRNFLLVAEDGGALLGGTVFHLLAGPNVGFSSFMAVAQGARGRGVARALHEERFAALDEAAGGPVPGVFIDVVNPARLTPEERAAEAEVGSDPQARRRIFARLGFRQVDIQYQQPVGGPDGGPVTNMDLLFCPHEPQGSVPTSLVVDTMRAYWTPWMGEKRAERYARELEARAGGRGELPLLPTLPPEPQE